jgi:hypothetical protein
MSRHHVTHREQRALVDELRRQHDVIWRMYCSGASLLDVQCHYPALGVDAIHAVLLDWHWVFTGPRIWYLLEPCCWCGDMTGLDWGARPVARRGWECFGCGLVRWLKTEKDAQP